MIGLPRTGYQTLVSRRYTTETANMILVSGGRGVSVLIFYGSAIKDNVLLSGISELGLAVKKCGRNANAQSFQG